MLCSESGDNFVVCRGNLLAVLYLVVLGGQQLKRLATCLQQKADCICALHRHSSLISNTHGLLPVLLSSGAS